MCATATDVKPMVPVFVGLSFYAFTPLFLFKLTGCPAAMAVVGSITVGDHLPVAGLALRMLQLPLRRRVVLPGLPDTHSENHSRTILCILSHRTQFFDLGFRVVELKGDFAAHHDHHAGGNILGG